MTLQLHTSNRLELLAEKLAESISTDPLPPLQPETIVVQSKGMEHWLKLEIARQNGICANIDFPFPRSFTYRMFGTVLDLPEETPFSPEDMTWQVMQALPELLNTSPFAMLKHYLSDDNSEEKRYRLAEKIARAFDQYLVYRPDIINDWDRGKNTIAEKIPHSQWQFILWQRITEGTSPALHHAAVKESFISCLRDNDFRGTVPRRIFVFGIPTLPPFYIDVLMALAEISDIHFFYLNPCREYWEYAYTEKEIERFKRTGLSAEDLYFESGNPLLASMGTCGREFFSLILSTAGDTGTNLFQDPGQHSLLARLQSDILNMTSRTATDPGNTPLPQTDRSFQMHACHSPMREVEVLYDNLLRFFDDIPGLLPKDILVMTPDIATYAPLVQAVFDAPDHEETHIPYSITDKSLRRNSSIADTFLSVVTLDRQRFTSTAVLDILENGAVYQKFGLAESDLELIRHWVRETGICWGIDGEYRRGLGLPPFRDNTWQSGRERLLLGYTLPETEQKTLFAGRLPFGEIEGGHAAILGAFSRFLDVLFTCTAALQKRQSLTAWSRELRNMLDSLFYCDEHTEHELKTVRDVLCDKGLAAVAARTGYSDDVSPAVVQRYLTSKLEHDSISHGFISSGVTFCTMLPMRSIPFRVIYMLGMNDGDYPRTASAPGFDLIQQQRRLCDRSKRYEDRYLFLETVLSARDCLIISYIGQSSKDNTELPPSVLVSELCDYCDQSFSVEGSAACRDHIVHRHPLQPFSSSYFKAGSHLLSYSEENCLACTAALKAGPPEPFINTPLPPVPPQTVQNIGIADLLMFFSNPCAFLLQHRLSLFLGGEGTITTEEREPFTLDRLQQYQLRQQLTKASLHKTHTESWAEALQAAGKLPHGPGGAAAFGACSHEAALFSETVLQHTGGAAPDTTDVHISLDSPKIGLCGILDNLFPTGQIFFRSAAVKTRDILKAWIRHLLLNASDIPGTPATTTVLGTDTVWAFNAIPLRESRRLLGDLAGLYLRGLTEPLCFFPDTSCTYAELVLRNGNADTALKAARDRAWHNTFFGNGESRDSYVRLCFGGELPESDDFKTTALTVFEPLFNHTAGEEQPNAAT